MPYLGVGFNYFLFSPLFGEDSHFDKYFSRRLKPPTTYQSSLSLRMALIDQVWSTTAVVVGHCFGTQFFRERAETVRSRVLFGRSFDASQSGTVMCSLYGFFATKKASCYLQIFNGSIVPKFQHFRISKQNSFSKFQYAKFRRLTR